jgi:aryl-alcohol dehydrogenase-like predicted oxidoreductase
LLDLVVAEGAGYVDTADTYCLGPQELHHNERLVAAAAERARAGGRQLHVGTKGGTVRTAAGWEIDASADRLYRVIGESYEALGGREPIFLWQLHWLDVRCGIADTFRVVRRAMDEKLIRFCGVGNMNVEQIRQARDVVDVVSVQNQFNFWHRESEAEGVIEYCERENLVFLPWRPMGGEGLAQRLGEIGPLAAIARERGVSPQRIVLAWQLAKSKAILPIPGSTKIGNVLDCFAAAELRLEAKEIAALDGLKAGDLPVRARPPAWEKTPRLAKAATQQ